MSPLIPVSAPSAAPTVAPLMVGRTDGWGVDDTLVVVVAVVAVLLLVALIGAVVPQHGGKVRSWRILGRAPEGFAAITATLNAGMAVFLVKGSTTGALLQGPVGVALGVAAAASTVAIAVGWWVRSLHRWVAHGLAMSAVVWGGISAANFAASLEVSGWIALCLTGFFGYAWVADVTDVGGHQGER